MSTEYGHPSIDTAVKILRADRYHEYVHSAANASKQDWEVTIGPDIWNPKDKRRVRKCLDAMMMGTLDSQGMAELDLPAEYVAAVIILVANPVNWMVASRWYENANTVESMISEDNTEEPQMFEQGMTARRIFAWMNRFGGGSNLEPHRKYLQELFAPALTVDEASR